MLSVFASCLVVGLCEGWILREEIQGLLTSHGVESLVEPSKPAETQETPKFTDLDANLCYIINVNLCYIDEFTLATFK